MRRLSVSTLVSTMILCLLNALLVFLARSDPPEFHTLPFDTCNLPCVAGATLGQANDVQQLSDRIVQQGYFADPPLHLTPNSSFRWRKPGLTAGVYQGIVAEFYNQQLQRVAIVYDPRDSQTPRLGDVINALGTPTCYFNDGLAFDATLKRSLQYFFIFYVNTDYILTITVGELRPSQPVSQIDMKLPFSPAQTCQRFTLWRGFVNY